jgi:uncharacterized protein (TIGR03437 family)
VNRTFSRRLGVVMALAWSQTIFAQPHIIPIGSSLTFGGTNAPDTYSATTTFSSTPVLVDNGKVRIWQEQVSTGSSGEWDIFHVQIVNGGPLAGDINVNWNIVMTYTLSVAAIFDQVVNQWSVSGTPVSPLSNFSGICCAAASNPIVPGEAYYKSGFSGPLPAGVFMNWQQTFADPYNIITQGGINPSTANEFTFALHFTVAGGPPPTINAVVNGASFVGGGVVPGEIATVFGTNIVSATGINLVSALPLATMFLSNSVLIDGAVVPLFASDNFNGQQQINFQVPFGVAGKSTVQVAVLNSSMTSASVTVPVLTAQPGIFNYSAGGKTFGAILHANFALADTNHPASPNETVLIFCTALGAVKSPPPDGTAGNGQDTVDTPNVTIGGANATVSFSGLAPGFVGLYQINAVVPTGLASGNQPVVVKLGGVSSNSVLLPVK